MKLALFSNHIQTQPYIGDFNYSKVSFQNFQNYCNYYGIDLILNTKINPKFVINDGKHDCWNGLSMSYAFYYAFQKFNIIDILKQNKYDYILYLDSDVLLTKNMGLFIQQLNVQNKKFFAVRDIKTKISTKKIVLNNLYKISQNFPEIKKYIKFGSQQLYNNIDTIIAGDIQVFTKNNNIYQNFQNYKQYIKNILQKTINTRKQSILDGHLMSILLFEKLYNKQIKKQDIQIDQLYQTKRQILYNGINKIDFKNNKIVEFSGFGSYTNAWQNRPRAMKLQYTKNRKFYW